MDPVGLILVGSGHHGTLVLFSHTGAGKAPRYWPPWTRETVLRHKGVHDELGRFHPQIYWIKWIHLDLAFVLMEDTSVSIRTILVFLSLLCLLDEAQNKIHSIKSRGLPRDYLFLSFSSLQVSIKTRQQINALLTAMHNTDGVGIGNNNETVTFWHIAKSSYYQSFPEVPIMGWGGEILGPQIQSFPR